MAKSYFYQFVILLVFSLIGTANANERVIKFLAEKEIVFTAVQIDLRGQPILVIDRIIKGNVNPTVMAFAQVHNNAGWGRRLVFYNNPGDNVLNLSAINMIGRFKVRIGERIETCKLEDMIFALDESPEGVHARELRRREKKAGEPEAIPGKDQEAAEEKHEKVPNEIPPPNNKGLLREKFNFPQT